MLSSTQRQIMHCERFYYLQLSAFNKTDQPKGPQSMDGDVDAPGPSFKEEYANPMDSSPTYIETYKQMEKLVENGKAKSLGVSNFSVEKLEKLLKEAAIKPITNQVSQPSPAHAASEH